MTIYGEYLFLENAVSGAVILYLTEKLCGYRRSAVWLTIGSILCGVYSFIIFVPMNGFLSLVTKLGFSAALVLLVFRPSTRLGLVKTGITFYIVSFLMGGTTVALMYLTGMQGLSANGSVYVHQITYVQVMSGILVTGVLWVWLAEHLKEKIHREAVMAEVEIFIGENHWKARAFVDTGNFLADPVTGYPAILLSAGLGQKIMDTLQEEARLRSCIIPYQSVGKKGLLHGLRPDCIWIDGESLRQVVLAVSQENFRPWKGTESYEILLQQQLFEGRIKKYA